MTPANIDKFINTMRSPVKMGFFMFTKLPAAYFSGVRLKEITPSSCRVSIPYKWFSQNPFRSTYFACQSMAAEMSTGALALGHLYKRKPAVSMLVVKTEGEYFKKAVDKTTFVCEDGSQIKKMIEEAVASGDGRTIRAKTIGKNKAGELVAEFFITWSFK